MNRIILGILAPSLALATAWSLVPALPFSTAVTGGIRVGLGVALVQCWVSVVALRWAWHKPAFYWVWGGGLAFRAVVFVVTALVVHQYSRFSLTSTLLSLVTATTGFLIIESSLFSRKKNGLS